MNEFESGSTKTNLADGVYLGFNVPWVENRTTPHPWIEVARGGQSITFEYGPKIGVGSDLVEQRSHYQDGDRTAGALYKLLPPHGTNPKEFIDRAFEGGNILDKYLEKNDVTYLPVLDADCDTAALALLKNIGGSQSQFIQMAATSYREPQIASSGFAVSDKMNAVILGSVALSSQIGGAMSPAMSEMAHVEAAMTTHPLAPGTDYTERLTQAIWQQLGPAPGIPSPGCGSIGITQMACAPSRAGEPEIWHEPISLPPPTMREILKLPEVTQTNRVIAGDERAGSSVPPLTEMSPERLARHVQLSQAVRSGFAAGFGGSELTHTIGVERNGEYTRAAEIPALTGRIIGFDDGRIQMRGDDGTISAVNHLDVLSLAREPIAMERLLRNAEQDGQKVVLTLDKGEVALASARDHQMLLDHQRLAYQELQLEQSHSGGRC